MELQLIPTIPREKEFAKVPLSAPLLPTHFKAMMGGVWLAKFSRYNNHLKYRTVFPSKIWPDPKYRYKKSQGRLLWA